MGCSIQRISMLSKKESSRHNESSNKLSNDKSASGNIPLSAKLDNISKCSATLTRKRKTMKWIEQIPNKVDRELNTYELHNCSMNTLEKYQKDEIQLSEIRGIH
ncbi:unnamed protein product [Phytomonas sp. Hart1]|nr:unnamed protein product [Phytomonas sp. Hart1]|eukprot:CCW65918.1 unnamed protein product [Phytomonas sp. isolate Hart1]